MARSRALRVLLVEDDPEDAKLLADAFAAACQISLRVVDDGARALDYLRRRPPFACACRPDLILLDLNLKTRSGIEILSEIKADEGLRVIPVIALTGSSDACDIWKAYSAGANCYMAKPVGLAAICALARRLSDFWGAAQLPPLSP